MLCQDCQGLFNHRLNQKTQLEFSRTKSSLQEAAANGCELCQSIYDGRFDDPFYTEKARAEHCRPVPVHDTEEVAHNLAFSYEGTNDIYPTVYILRDGKQAIPYWLVKLEGNSTAAADVPRSDFTFSAEACHLASGWMDHCTRHHNCCKDRDMTRYPTRLIDIGKTSLLTEKPQIRLCDPRKERPETPYITLSHVWGKAKFLTLTSSNIDEFFNEIPYDKLSNVFKDAIAVTWKFGMRYLWIDSLCIIQSGDGSVEDWEHESSRMGDVYANAYCNIGASYTTDENNGMFHTREPIKVMPTIEVNLRGLLTTVKGRYVLRPQEYMNSTMESFPLLSRAWVFQERFLCARMIHFGRDEIVWECNESVWSERCPNDEFGVQYIGKSKHSMNGNAYSRKNEIWADKIISSYCGCGITVASDILPAFSGAALDHAKKYRSSQETYIAGLWLSDMPKALAWFIKPEHRQEEATQSLPRSAYRAPSWSWACLNRGINHLTIYDQHWKSSIDIIAHELKLQSSNKFGPVIHASLTLRCRLNSWSWIIGPNGRDNGSHLTMIDQEGDSKGTYYPDEYPISESGNLLCFELLHSRTFASLETILKQFRRRLTMGMAVKKCMDQDAYVRTGFFVGYYNKSRRLFEAEDIIKII